jgi:hypothetical protein
MNIEDESDDDNGDGTDREAVSMSIKGSEEGSKRLT